MNKWLSYGVVLLLLIFTHVSYSQVSESSVNKEQTKQVNKPFKLSPEMQAAMARNTEQNKTAVMDWQKTVITYLKSGFIHIVPKGLDHILFVLGLFFSSIMFRKLIWQVSAFTLAHTITLMLASLGVVSVSSNIVEPLIALSIVYIAVENIRDKTSDKIRLLVVFLFGLLHGLGFASVLADFGLATNAFVTSLLAFNIGVELGQLTVILLALSLFYFVRQKAFYRPFVQVPASLLIGAVGLFWTLERVL